MKKPAACQGCPFYDDGRGEFVPDEVRAGSSVMIVGQNPGADEAASGKPFVGKTGQAMDKYLRDAGLTRDEVSVGNSLRCRVRNSNDLPPVTARDLRDALAHCAHAHLRIPAGTRLLVAQGDYAALQLTGGTVGEWRGYLRPFVGRPVQAMAEPWVPEARDTPVLLTTHLARLFREPSLTLPTRLDWGKIPRILSGKWPRKPPAFRLTAPEEWPAEFAFDTEYWVGEDQAPTSARLTRWSASWGTGDNETCVVEAGGAVPQLAVQRPRVVTQYAPADVHHLAKLAGLDWRSHEGTGRGNHVRSLSPLGADLSSRGQQENMAALHALRGIKPDAEATESLLVPENVWEAFLIEDTVWKHAVLWSDHAHDLNYLGSIYSSFNRWKHLGESDPILYSGLDAVGLLEVDRALEREFDADPQSRRVWNTIDRPALRHFVTAQYHGLRVNPQRVKDVLAQADAIAQDASLRAQALAGWPISLASNPQVGHQLYAVEGLGPKRQVR